MLSNSVEYEHFTRRDSWQHLVESEPLNRMICRIYRLQSLDTCIYVNLVVTESAQNILFEAYGRPRYILYSPYILHVVYTMDYNIHDVTCTYARIASGTYNYIVSW
jgi:hypothetical protein